MAEQTTPEQPKPRLFVIAEDKVQILFNEFQELPFKVANPLINFLQKNLQEVRPEQVKEAPSESTEPIKEG
jgi:hypothetical protein